MDVPAEAKVPGREYPVAVAGQDSRLSQQCLLQAGHRAKRGETKETGCGRTAESMGGQSGKMHPKTLGIWRAATWWRVKEAEGIHTVLGAKDQHRNSEIDPEEIKHPTETET